MIHSLPNFKIIARVLSSLAFLEAILLLVALLVGIFNHEGAVLNFWVSLAVSMLTGVGLFRYGRGAPEKITRREGYLCVGLTWIMFSLIGALPFLLVGEKSPGIAQSFFEAFSGFTTTGATAIPDLDAMPASILFWRSLMHWLGGLGIVFFTVALLPRMSAGSTKLFAAESTGLKMGKLHPRVSTTARWVWGIYITLTLACTASLYLAGMSLFDAVNHAMSTVSSGGFSTHTASIGFFNSPAVEYVVIVFMFLAGVNFTLIYLLVIKRRLSAIWRDGELRTYVYILCGATVVILISSLLQGIGAEKSLRDALFHTVSMQTTTGFITMNFTDVWPLPVCLLIFLLELIGPMAGSTGGGVKCVRVLTSLKIMAGEFRHILHPRAVLPVRLGNQVIGQSVIRAIFAFFTVYVLLLFFGAICFTLMGYPLLDSFGLAGSLLGNIGPIVGHNIQPASSLYALPDAGLWLGSFLMLAGRLEIFAILLPFVPSFWRED